MTRRCVCGHDEDEHVEGIGCDAEVEAPDVFCACERFTLSDTDKEAAGQLTLAHTATRRGLH